MEDIVVEDEDEDGSDFRLDGAVNFSSSFFLFGF
jgi:hypothetical protein